MSVKTYGIFLAYNPPVDLRTEGLGRHLGAFLRAAVRQKDVRFVVACPSWTRRTLLDLCESEGVDPSGFEILTPAGEPFVLKVIARMRARLGRPRRLGPFARVSAWLRARYETVRAGFENALSRSRGPLDLVMLASCGLVIGLAALPVLFLYALALAVRRLAGRLVSIAGIPGDWQSMALSRSNFADGFARRVYKLAIRNEIDLLVGVCNRRGDISAWYCPAAFWPFFNRLEKPGVMCVPDVVLNEFPVGFSAMGAGLVEDYSDVVAAIEGGRHFITYSEQIRWATLVDRYGKDPARVHVIHHAPSRLDGLVTIGGMPDPQAASLAYARRHLLAAIAKSGNDGYVRTFANPRMQFVFYASQFRPNKNIMTLLRAYRVLQQDWLHQHKLVLTGRLSLDKEAEHFLRVHKLENEVLCLHGLSTAELAACYKLADVAVNPSFSEGGCPFTFTEALSVGTPVVMASTAVASEILVDASLQQTMFFDPYDYRSLADRLAWALANRDRLLAIQQPVFDRLARRTWDDVVGETIDILHGLEAEAAQLAPKRRAVPAA